MASQDSPDEAQLFEIVRRRYGEGLSDEELEQVRNGVREVMAQAAALAAVKLDAAAEPGPLFRPYADE